MLSAKLCAQLTPEVVSKLREAMGIATVCDLVSKDASDIARRTGLNITVSTMSNKQVGLANALPN